jgi:hypothetical protein
MTAPEVPMAAKEKTIIGSNGVWLVKREHKSKRGKAYKRMRKVASPSSGTIIRGRHDH